MNFNFKKIIAAALAAVICVSLCGCHGKDEVAVSAGDVSLTSAMYSCCMVQAYNEGANKVYQNDNTVSDYFTASVESKPFATWVEDRTNEIVKLNLALLKLENEGKIKLTDDEKSAAETEADQYWNNYSYNTLYEPNGVSYSTFKKSILCGYLKTAYFNSFYGKGGSEEVKEADIKKAMNTNYEAVRTVSTSITSDMTDADTASLKNKYNGYAEKLKKDSSAFANIYKEVNGMSDSDFKSATRNSSGVKDPLATIIGGKNTTSPDDDFAAIKSMAKGEVKVFTSSSSVKLVIKGDINDDVYYYTTLKDTVLHLIKDDEFNKKLEEKEKELDIKTNSFATNQFKVKKIKIPESTNG